MRFVSIFLACAALLLGACGESSLPDPTGKGSVRAINAIPASPVITFRIEERTVGAAEYKSGTSATSFDDFSYNFNFEVEYLGDSEPTRIASQELQVVAGKDYVFVVGGTLDNASVTVWESDERTWTGSETSFEMRFGHAAASFGSMDVYFVPENDVAGANNLADTLAYGESGAASEVAEGSYTVVATTAGDINDVLFQSDELAFTSQTTLLVTFFDGDENDLTPITVRAIQPGGAVFAFADSRTEPTTRFIHASADLGPVDIYDDEGLANRVVANQVFGGVSAEVPRAAGTWTATYTPPNDTGVTLLEKEANTVAGTRISIYAVGLNGEYDGVALLQNRRSVSVEARLSFFHASVNHQQVDLYIEEPGAVIDEASSEFFGLPLGASTGSAALAEGDYEIFVTTSGESTVLAGPFPISVALGDVVEALILDDPADTAIAEIRLIQNP